MSSVTTWLPSATYSGVGTWFKTYYETSGNADKYAAFGFKILWDNDTQFAYEMDSISVENRTSATRWCVVYRPMGDDSIGGQFWKVKVDPGKTAYTAVNANAWRYVVNKGHSGQSINGYWRVRWFNDSACTSLANDWHFGVTSNVSVKTSYTVSYNANGGNAVSSQVKWYGEALTLRGAATRSGFSFVRWNTNTSNTGTGYNAGASYTANAGITLYAIWNHTVSYNANGGSGAPSSQTALSSSAITLSSARPAYTGYEFVRWNTNTSNTGTGYAPGGSYAANQASATLYAIWQRRVTYKANGGTGSDVEDTSLKTASYTIRADCPFTRSGWRFTGWNTAADGQGTAKSGSYSDGALTLYAQWERIVGSVEIGDARAIRVEATTGGEARAEADEGSYAYVRVPFSVTGAAAADVELTATCEDSQGNAISNFVTTAGTVTTATKQQGTRLDGVFEVWAGAASGQYAFDTDKSYVFNVTVTAENSEGGVTQADVTAVKQVQLSAAYFTIDVLGDGRLYQPTSDTAVDQSKTYYVQGGGGFEEVDSPALADIATYYEKSGPRPGHGVSFGGPALVEGHNVSMPSFTYGLQDYPFFITAAIASFAPPLGVDKCMVLDTSDYGLYWYTA